MATVKISELPAMTNIASSDILPIVDVSETETKKVTKEMLLTDIDASQLEITHMTHASSMEDNDFFIISQSGTTKKITKRNAKLGAIKEIPCYRTDTTPPEDICKFSVEHITSSSVFVRSEDAVPLKVEDENDIYITEIGNQAIIFYDSFTNEFSYYTNRGEYYRYVLDNSNWIGGKETASVIELKAIDSTAPATCSVGDKYYNTTTNYIYTATHVNTWGVYGVTPRNDSLYLIKSTQELYAYGNNTMISVGGGSGTPEIAISTTQPSGNEVLWINPDEIPTGQGSYISNEYGTSQEIGYSQEYVNNHFGKSLWTGSFTSGSINVPDLDKYKIIGIVADGVFCIGNKSFGGGIYGIYGGTGNGIVSYRLSNSGTVLSINSNDKGAYNNGTQVAITDIIGIM